MKWSMILLLLFTWPWILVLWVRDYILDLLEPRDKP